MGSEKGEENHKSQRRVWTNMKIMDYAFKICHRIPFRNVFFQKSSTIKF